MRAILFLLHHPEVKTKLHKELDEVVASSMPSMMDEKKDLPYTKSVIKEVLRSSSILYAGIPHVWYVMHDPAKWDNHIFSIQTDFCTIPNIQTSSLSLLRNAFALDVSFSCPADEELPSYDILPKDRSETSNSIVIYAPPCRVIMTSRHICPKWFFWFRGCSFLNSWIVTFCLK